MHRPNSEGIVSDALADSRSIRQVASIHWECYTVYK